MDNSTALGQVEEEGAPQTTPEKPSPPRLFRAPVGSWSRGDSGYRWGWQAGAAIGLVPAPDPKPDPKFGVWGQILPPALLHNTFPAAASSTPRPLNDGSWCGRKVKLREE